jgi:hypothetical protein
MTPPNNSEKMPKNSIFRSPKNYPKNYPKNTPLKGGIIFIFRESFYGFFFFTGTELFGSMNFILDHTSKKCLNDQ